MKQSESRAIAGATKKKLACAIALEIVGAVLLALLIAWWQPLQSMSNFKSNFPAKLDLAASLVDEVGSNADAVTARYDSLYTAKADTIALYAQTKDGFSYSASDCQDLFDLISVDGLYVVDAQGAIVQKVGSVTGLDAEVAAAAKMVFAAPDAFEPYTTQVAGTSMRFYASKVDDAHAIVLAKQPTEIAKSVESLASVSDELNDVAVGSTGFVMAIDADGVVAHHGDSALIGQSRTDIGITDAQMQDGFTGDITMNGERYVCQTKQADQYTLIAAMPYSEFNEFTATYVCLGVVVYLIAASILLAFMYFMGTDRRRKSVAVEGSARYKKFGGFVRNADIGAKAIPLGVGCLIFVLVAMVYLCTLIELSGSMVSNTGHVETAIADLTAADKTSANIDSESTVFTEDKAKLSAYMLARLDKDQLTRDFMIELRDALNCSTVWFFDTDGSTIASDNSYWGYQLSDDPDSFSYQLKEILLGRKSMVVLDSEGTTSDWSVTRYVGYVVQDDNLQTIGMVEVGSDQSLQKKMQSSLSESSVLRLVQPGSNGFAFAVNQESGKFTYYPDADLVGELATDFGISNDNLMSGYSDFLTVNDQTYLCASGLYNGDYIYVATPSNAIVKLAMPTATVTVLFSLVWFIVLLLFTTLRTRKSADALEAEHAELDRVAADADAQVTDVTVDGRTKLTTTVVGRWSSKGIAWDNRTPGQKISAVCRALFSIIAIIFLILVIFADNLFDESSMFHYLLNGTWQPGLNLFALTRCVMTCLVVYAVVDIVRRLLTWFGASMTAKGETICRLLDNILKFAFWIWLIYYCMATLGADTTVLLTSAGILTLVVGLGANSLITDIIAGLFIVFEGEFQVGDIVSIGDFRGTVQEIGVRTTKIKSGDGNVKVFANRNVSGVVNMTKDLSSVTCKLMFSGDLSLERIEARLSEALPRLRADLPAIVDGPYYRGVAETGDNVTLQIVATCKENDRGQLERDLNRELRLFTEEILLGPDAKANSLEKIIAEKFSNEQAEASKDVQASEGE